MTSPSQPAARPPRPAIVFLHGLGQMPQAWQPQVEAMPAGYQGFAPWVLGTKPTDRQPYDTQNAAGAITTLLQLNGLTSAHIVGMSLGGIVALQFACEYPDMVASLTVAGAQAKIGRTVMALQRMALKRLPEHQLPSARRQRLLQVTQALAGLDLLPGLRRLTVPTLVIAGQADRVGVAAARQIHEVVRGSRLEIVGGGGDLNVTQPQEFNRVTFPFIERHT